MISKNNTVVFIIAVFISILASFFGLDFSFHYDFPAGSSIVAVLGGIFVLASIIRLIKGLVTRTALSKSGM
jgi:ABC-type Mn2+/Zn2+ transport system permease subunit